MERIKMKEAVYFTHKTGVAMKIDVQTRKGEKVAIWRGWQDPMMDDAGFYEDDDFIIMPREAAIEFAEALLKIAGNGK
jgi:hypothetical protein